MTVGAVAAALIAEWAAYAAIMGLAWIIQQRTGNSGWVDVLWSLGLGTVGSVGSLLPLSDEGEPGRRWLVAALVAIAALRLGGHILTRTLKTEDDPRYRDLATQWGEAAPTRMFWFLQAQALASVPLLASILVAAQRPGSLALTDGVGAALLALAVAGEALADRQLAAFKREFGGRGAVCDRGLWSWSRHPNYFFEWLGWLAYPVIAIDAWRTYPLGFLAVSGPATMYWLLVYVSGIPLLEAQMLRSRGEAYRRYQATTSAFWPRPPR